MILKQRGQFMKLDIKVLFIFAIFLTVLPGCGRIVDWGKDNFYQGKNLDKNIEDVRRYIKSKRVYDQFTIVGHFDALWLSDDVRTDYSDVYCCRHSKNKEQKRMFLRRQLEENNHFITFYVLSLKDIVLGDKDSKWSVSLEISDRVFQPLEVKTIDLSPEYIDIFGKKYNKFKDVYLVYFNAKDVEDRYIIDEKTEKMVLVFRSVEKKIELSWDLK